PNLEVVNLSLEGSGTDQQLLMLERVGLNYEFDLVLLFPFLQNIRRNMVDAREGHDPMTGETVLLPKPRFELVGTELMLRNVPVPADRFRAPQCPNQSPSTDANRSRMNVLKTRINRLPGMNFAKKLIFTLRPWEPFPEYKDPRSPQWRLMEAII